MIADKLATTIARKRRRVDKDVTSSQEPQLNTGFAVRPDQKGSFQCAIPMRHIFGFPDE